MIARHRLIFLLFVLLAPFGWLMFWAVFHTVPGQDFVVFDTAEKLLRAGDVKTLSDPAAFTDYLNRIHTAWFAKPLTAIHPWVYPPVALLIAIAFCWMPYPAALAAFLCVTIAAIAAALWQWERVYSNRLALIFFVLLCPASAFALGAGQLSFFVAAIVLAGMAALDKKPFLAGLIFSVLCMKPQFGLLIPVALLAGRYFRGIAGAACGVLVLVIVSALLFGIQVWVDWLSFVTGANPWFARLMQQMRLYDQSMHSTLHMLGAGESLAGIGQIAILVAACICVWKVFAERCDLRRRITVLLTAMVAGAPHVSGYDHVLLAIAAMFVLLDPRPLLPGAAPLAASVWLATLINPPALMAVLGIPLLTGVSALSGFLPVAFMMIEARMFFFEKKNQKTFAS
jgi:hypothetical protein